MAGRIINIILCVVLVTASHAQTGGDNIYEFLNLTQSGFISSVGGVNVSVFNKNLNMAYENPSLLNSSMDRSVALNYTNYMAGINYGLAMYSRSLPGKGNFAAGITYLNYGTFIEADPSGNITGTFGASEYAFSLMHSLELDSMFTAGLNFKPVISHLEKYTSVGFALDLGGSWHSRDGLLSAGLVIKNIGYQITTYEGEQREKPPFEVRAGISTRLVHAPFRFSLTLRHLEKFDLTWTYPGSGSGQNNRSNSSEFIENLMRHFIIGTEIIPHKNFYLSFGYNYQRRSELRVESGDKGAGFSWGFGINTSVISMEFGRASYHLAGASNHLSLILRPDLIYRKGQK
jgi:hypothetical protein